MNTNYNLVYDIKKFKLSSIEFKIIKVMEYDEEYYIVKYLVPMKRLFRKVSYIWKPLSESDYDYHGYYYTIEKFKSQSEAENKIKLLTKVKTTTVVSHFNMNLTYDHDKLE